MSTTAHPKGKGCWYLTTIHACPVCGREEVFRQRQYDVPKPADVSDRYEYVEIYDYCNAL